MEQQLVDIREQQRSSWNNFSGGWRKWNQLTMAFLHPVGDDMIHALDLKDSDIVLDVASGTGEPGLSIAQIVKNGKVVLTDLSDKMLIIAKENAIAKGLSNIETQVCDVCELPFANATFDAVSCRFGFMFFPDMALAAKEILRVLKPGGRLVTSVWDIPDKNFWVTATMGAIARNMDVPAPPPDSPGIFRCAKEGLMTQILSSAGFVNTIVRYSEGKMECKTADVYWSMMTEVAAPVVAALNKADRPTQEKIKQEVYNVINQKYPEGEVILNGSAIVLAAQRP